MLITVWMDPLSTENEQVYTHCNHSVVQWLWSTKSVTDPSSSFFLWMRRTYMISPTTTPQILRSPSLQTQSVHTVCIPPYIMFQKFSQAITCWVIFIYLKQTLHLGPWPLPWIKDSHQKWGYFFYIHGILIVDCRLRLEREAYHIRL